MTRKRKTRDAVPRNARIPRNSREWEQQRDALHALKTALEEGLTRSHAAKAEGMRERTLAKWTLGAWQRRGRDYVPKPFDRIPRPVTLTTSKGEERIWTRGSRDASLIARWDNAVKEFAKTGKSSVLRPFVGKRIPGRKAKFDTSPSALNKAKDAGLLDIKDFYWRPRGHRA